MPKSAKKRKDKAADFSKAKLKLGKGKKAAANAIDTSYKARSIALPTQRIAVEKDDAAPTTRRRLTFEDLISQVKHYSAGIRKDAILGLRELLEANPHLLESSLTSLFTACVRIIGDEDASVRKLLLTFFGWLFPQIRVEDLTPHLPLLLLFTTSAQTHIFPEIRIDAIRFLDLFLEYAPRTVVEGWSAGNSGHGSRILEGYLGILSAGTSFGELDGPMKATSTASVVLTPASKLIVLQSLSTFLHNALLSPHHQSKSSLPSNTIPTWYFNRSFSSTEACSTFNLLLQPAPGPVHAWRPEVESDDCHRDDFTHPFPLVTSPPDEQWSLQELSEVANVAAEEGASQLVDMNFVAHLARTLHSTLIATFLDSAPSVFSPSGNPSETEVKLVAAVAEVTRSLYAVILQGSALPEHSREASYDELKTILGYQATYFPFTPTGVRDVKVEQIFQDLNLIFCELTSLLMLSAETRVTRSRASRKAFRAISHKAGVLASQTERVSAYVIKLLGGEAASASHLPRPLSTTAYTALLPTIWSFLNHTKTAQLDGENMLLQATLAHAIRTSSKAASKRPTLEFVARILLLNTETQYQGYFSSNGQDGLFDEWISHLPQTLWELGSSNLQSTETILRFLLRYMQRTRFAQRREVTSLLRTRMVPYFTIVHPIRGRTPGPYAKLPSESGLRHLALDTAAMFLTDASDVAISTAVEQALISSPERSYWVRLKTALKL